MEHKADNERANKSVTLTDREKSGYCFSSMRASYYAAYLRDREILKFSLES